MVEMKVEVNHKVFLSSMSHTNFPASGSWCKNSQVKVGLKDKDLVGKSQELPALISDPVSNQQQSWW